MRVKTHPGMFLKQEIMKSQKLTNKFIYKNSKTSREYWRGFFKGDVDLVDDMAFELSDKLNISVDFWVSMQSKHNTSKQGV